MSTLGSTRRSLNLATAKFSMTGPLIIRVRVHDVIMRPQLSIFTSSTLSNLSRSISR